MAGEGYYLHYVYTDNIKIWPIHFTNNTFIDN